MKPVLVGEDNPWSADPRHVLVPFPRGMAGDRLRRIFRMTDREYLRAFRRVNLCATRWSLREAQARAKDLTFSGEPLVLLGSKVALAFRVPFVPFKRRGNILVLPHPSGRCRLWNDPRNARRARRAVRRLLRATIGEESR